MRGFVRDLRSESAPACAAARPWDRPRRANVIVGPSHGAETHPWWNAAVIMGARLSTIADQGLDLLDGLHALIDVAFAHDLAVSFTDTGAHDSAASLTRSLVVLVEGIEAELPHTRTLGTLGALLGTLGPFADALHEMLLDSAHHLGARAVLAVLRTRRPVELALAHLRTAARLGASQPVELDRRTSLQLAAQALLPNLRSFGELLAALDPLLPELELEAPMMPEHW